MVTMEMQRQVLPNESESNTCPLPTPINVQQLQNLSRNCVTILGMGPMWVKLGNVLLDSLGICPLPSPNQILLQKTFPRKWPWGELQALSPPHPSPISRCHPLDWFPKKHSTKFRTIFHLSFPKSGEMSFNSSIPKEDFSLQYITIDNAIPGILSLGQGCFLAKTDIESAFRLIPLRPSDYELFGMYWEGSYYYDKVLPFGLKCT